jgi:hypothetical protein
MKLRKGWFLATTILVTLVILSVFVFVFTSQTFLFSKNLRIEETKHDPNVKFV